MSDSSLIPWIAEFHTAGDFGNIVNLVTYLESFAQRQISVMEGIDPIFLSKHIFIMAAESATGRFIGL